jgi:acyl-CoA reductase-like NAD-dependent aldehyde dehydrogenase
MLPACVDSPIPCPCPATVVSGVETTEVQKQWAARSIGDRRRVLRRTRGQLAARVDALCDSTPRSLRRTAADTMIAEILPLLEACRFLEREAPAILRVRRLGRRGLPFWLGSIDAEVHRVALGRVLVIGPENYPLLLPGVQAMQALTAGNSVVWKPAPGGRAVGEVFAAAMQQAGLPEGLLRITGESVEAAEQELLRGVDKVFFTGSSTTGRILLRQLAETLTPCVAELSGCDAVVVLPSADRARVIKALMFGMRLNGSATCMSPRRLLLVDHSAQQRIHLIEELCAAFATLDGIPLAAQVCRQLDELLEQAIREGAQVRGQRSSLQRPILVTNVRPHLQLAQQDIFAPVLSVIEVEDRANLAATIDACPYALTIAVFGEENQARALASQLTAGTVMVNDLIVPTADPRMPFGGRRQSGFGVTRGREGLLEMTAIKAISVRRSRSTRHFEAAGKIHADLFEGIIQASHAAPWKDRIRGVRKMLAAGRKLR